MSATGTRAKPNTPMTDRVRALSTVDDNGCWSWIGAKHTDGYGRVLHNGKTSIAHRVSYLVFVGPIPDGLQLDHLCRNRACVNPAHLEPVTAKVNLHRSPITNATKTHCPRGHAYAEHGRSRKDGRRHCITCNNERGRARRLGITRDELDILEGRSLEQREAA